jgi:hypothetical protein
VGAWDALSLPKQQKIISMLAGYVHAHLNRDYAPDDKGWTKDPPRMTVLMIDDDGTRVTLHFLADHYDYRTTWSGDADWTDHCLFVGTGVIEGDQLTSHQFTSAYSTSLDDQQRAGYDRDLIASIVGSHAIAQRPGGPSGVPAADAAVAKLNAVTAAKRAEALAREEARNPPVSQPIAPEPTSHCPKCGSSDAGFVEQIFENQHWRCNACGFYEYLTWMDDNLW